MNQTFSFFLRICCKFQWNFCKAGLRLQKVGEKGEGRRGGEGMVDGGIGLVGRGMERPGERRRPSFGHLRESNNEG